jgi:integrase
LARTGRPPLPIGTAGSIRFERHGPKSVRARCRYRDTDGVTRDVEAWGTSQQDARGNLNEKLKLRKRTATAQDIGPDSYVKDVVALWLAKLDERVKAGKRSPGTARTYRVYIESAVLPRLGELRVREVTVSRVDAVIQHVAKENGPSAASTTRSVISGIMSLAARYDAIDANPTREAEAVDAPAKKPARALSLDEVGLMRGKIRNDRKSRERDLPDFVDMLLATGVRIGEVCAIRWDDLNLVERTVDIRGVVVRVKGEGLIIKDYENSKTKHRTLVLPRWAVAMLLNRQVSRMPNKWTVVFTSPRGLLRDPSNTNADLREVLDKVVKDDEGNVVYPAMPEVTSHVLGRKTVLTLMDKAGLPASAAADQAGHSKVSMTQDNYFARKVLDTGAADVLDAALGPSGTE